MPHSWSAPIQQDARTHKSGLTPILLSVFALLIGWSRMSGAQPAYTLAARLRAGYRLEISVRVNGAGPFWCTLDSGAGGGFLLQRTIGEAAGLRGTGKERGAGEGPDSVMDDIVPDIA